MQERGSKRRENVNEDSLFEVWLESRDKCHCLPEQVQGGEPSAAAMSDFSLGTYGLAQGPGKEEKDIQ